MDMQHQINGEMDGGPGPSRGLAALTATGEEDGSTPTSPVTVYDAAGPNPNGRLVADAHMQRIWGQIHLTK